MKRRVSRRLLATLVIVLIVLLSRIPLFEPVRDGIRMTLGVPARALAATTDKVKNGFKVFFTVRELNRENTHLRSQLAEKEAELSALLYARGENEKLKQDLKFQQEHNQLKLTQAYVVNYSPTGFYHALTINKGRRDGLQIGQAVVANGFLVGKINALSDKTAEVWLLSNRNLVTPVMLANTQTVGLLKGSIRGLVIENIPLDTKIEKGEPIVTSSLEGLYPPGIAVGKVEEILSAKEEIFLTLRISTPVNAANLVSVYVLGSSE